MENGFLVKTAGRRRLAVGPAGRPGMGLVDFTNPDAARWYKDQLAEAPGSRAWTASRRTSASGSPPTSSTTTAPTRSECTTTTPTCTTGPCSRCCEEERGTGKAVVFARSATVGSQKFPVHWGGDCSATYESMAESLRGGLSLGLSGFGFWSHDISGFEKTATPDLYRRWAAFGLLSSHSRLHGNESYRVPWLFGEESTDVLRFFVQLKCRLMPYLFAAAVEAARDGIPVMRAMILEFPGDPGLRVPGSAVHARPFAAGGADLCR